MKKLILLFIALSFLVVSADANYYGVIARKNATCDTTNIILFWTAEVEDISSGTGDNSNSSGGLCAGGNAAGTDCSNNDETFTATLGITLEAGAAKFGSKGMDRDTTFDTYLITTPLATMDDSGRIGSWVRINTWGDNAEFFQVNRSGDDKFGLRMNATDGELEFYWIDATTTRTACVTTNASLSRDGVPGIISKRGGTHRETTEV